MNPWLDLQRQSEALEGWQLLLMLLFLLGYAGSIGRLLDGRGRIRSALLAVASGITFCVLMAPWVLGALMLAAAVGVVGLFTGFVMILSRMLGVDRRAAQSPALQTVEDAGAAPRPAAVRATRPLTAG